MTENKNNIPELRFPEFEINNWDIKKFGEITAKIGSGSTPLGGEAVYQKQGIPFIRSQNVFDNKLKLDEVFISNETNRKMSGSIVQPNDVLLNITGASIGRSCVVPHTFIIGNVNQHVCIIRLKKDYNPKFIQSFIASHRGQKLVYQGQTGSGREGLNFQSIAIFKLYIPTLPEQQKIASFLTAVDDKIQKLTKKKELLEKYKKGIMQKIFSQEIRFKDDDGNDYPAWEERKLKEITTIFDGTHMTPDYQESGIPFYSVEHVTANNFSVTKFISKDVFEKENKRIKLEKEDILMTRIGDIGTSRYIDWDVKASFYVSLALLKKTAKNNTKYLNQYIRSSFFQKELHKRTIHVAFPKKINLGEIGECFVDFPSHVEQQKIADFLTSIDKKIESVTAQIDKTKQFKKGLLQKMFV